MTIWVNTHGKHGCWTIIIDGQPLRIDYVPADFSGKNKHYRITTRYNTEMFNHQYYSSLKQAKSEAIRMLKAHLADRRPQDFKG